jgi:hypothetical protein
MNLMTHFIETEDKGDIGVAAAWIRSAQQDIREQRRGLLAGRQAWKLDPRKDDDKPKLLTLEEEKRIKPEGKGKGKGGWQQQHQTSSSTSHYDRQSFQSRSTPFWRSRSKSRDARGKGKGKYKGNDQK